MNNHGQYTTGIICKKCGRATARNIRGYNTLCFYCYNDLCELKLDVSDPNYQMWVRQEFYLRPLFYGMEPNHKEIEKLYIPEQGLNYNRPKLNVKEQKPQKPIEIVNTYKKNNPLNIKYYNDHKLATISIKTDNSIDTNHKYYNVEGYPQSCFDGWE